MRPSRSAATDARLAPPVTRARCSPYRRALASAEGAGLPGARTAEHEVRHGLLSVHLQRREHRLEVCVLRRLHPRARLALVRAHRDVLPVERQARHGRRPRAALRCVILRHLSYPPCPPYPRDPSRLRAPSRHRREVRREVDAAPPVSGTYTEHPAPHARALRPLSRSHASRPGGSCGRWPSAAGLRRGTKALALGRREPEGARVE